MTMARWGDAQRAFTLIDLLTTIAILAIAVGVALPSATPDGRARLRGGVSLIASDIEYAQTLSLASPSDPAVVRFSNDGLSYWIARVSDPNEPLPFPGTEGPYLIALGQGRAALLFDCAIATSGLPQNTLTFDEFARPTSLAPIAVTLANSTDAISLRVSTSTGAIEFGSH